MSPIRRPRCQHQAPNQKRLDTNPRSSRTPFYCVVPLTCHVWQGPLYQNNSGTQIPDTNVVSLEKTAQWGSGDDQRTESWHYLPQEMDSSHTLNTTQTRFNVREKGTEVTDFPSLEEGILTQSENQVKESNRDLLCSPLIDFYFQKLKTMQQPPILQLTFVKGVGFNRGVVLSEFCRGARIRS
ncbi:centrosome-associated protein ALMS1-like [Physeter macrocephalus]|uniref:Centrosome-associated protein ALMS1-like n=1 Tax=Physeter macrocephalus TaxID=9755 RepID=A0A9W2X0B0_PHYMC|nr:centrosome-associated protein ALMS1-like [Physeter catodon]